MANKDTVQAVESMQFLDSTIDCKQRLNSFESLVKLNNDVQGFGFKWPHVDMASDQIRSELSEVKEAIDGNESKPRIQEELGDLLNAVISLIVFLDFDVEETVSKTLDKFEKRIKGLQDILQKSGLQSLDHLTIDEKLALWREVKRREAE